MKIPFLSKTKVSRAPSLESLRGGVFDTLHFWSISLIGFIVVCIAMMVVGANFFSYVYLQNYKQEKPADDSKNFINVDRLEKTLQDRADIISATSTIPSDPAIRMATTT